MRIDIALSVVLILTFGAALWMVTGYRWQVALAPGLAAGVGLCLVSVELFRLIRKRSGSPDEQSDSKINEIGWFLLAVVSVCLLGFATGGGLFVFAYTLASQDGEKSIWKALFSAAPVPLVVIGLFQYFLEIRLFPGLLFD